MNTYSAEKHFLFPAIVAARIRIVPFSARWRTICMRVELYGCPFPGKAIQLNSSIISYFFQFLKTVLYHIQLRQALTKIMFMTVGQSLFSFVAVILLFSGGLGKLTDGIIGSDENAWLAWNKSPVKIDFHFDTYRQFSIIRIYSMNNKYR